MKLHLVCLLLVDFQLALAEVYNYGAGSAGTGTFNPGQGQVPSFPGTGDMFNPTNPLGGSWTYQSSSWSNQVTPSPWTPATPSWTTQWASWSPVTNQAAIDSGVSQFTKYNGNCQGNYLGAVTQLTLDACAAACLGNPACAGFSFNLQSPYPQCILKNAVCASPDPTATFTFFARNGVPPTSDNFAFSGFVPAGPPIVVSPPYVPPQAPIVAPAPVIPAVPPIAPVATGPGIYSSFGAVDPYSPFPVPSFPFWKSATVRQFKSTGAQYYELPGNCSGPILRGPFYENLENCADQCTAADDCTGFSFDNKTNACIMHTGICKAMTKSKQWSYFARSDARRQLAAAQEAENESSAQSYAPQVEYEHSHHEVAMNELEHVEPEYSHHAERYHQRGLPYRQSHSRPFMNQQSSGRNYGFPYNANPMALLNHFEQYTGNCPGNAIGETLKMPLDECARLCLYKSSCDGFSFNVSVDLPEDFQCMLKSQSCSKPTENSPFRFFRKRKYSGMSGYRYRHLNRRKAH